MENLDWLQQVLICLLIVLKQQEIIKCLMKKKGQEITKKLGGAATSTAFGIKAAKYIAKGIKILRSKTGIGIIGGFALDCIFSYLLGKSTDDLTEDLLQKIFDYMGL